MRHGAELATQGVILLLHKVAIPVALENGPEGVADDVVLSAVVALLVTMTMTPIVINWMRRLAAVDQVTERSSHLVPTYRGGGVAVALGLFTGTLVPVIDPAVMPPPEVFVVVVAVALFGLIGLIEDVHGIPAPRRLGLQIAAAGTTVAAWFVVARPELPVQLVLPAACAAALWITGFTNSFNFMDGINGISAGQTLVTGIAFALVGHWEGLDALRYGGAMAVGVALGFGPYNFPHAKIFLGDVGSYALGAMIAVLALTAVAHGVRPETVVAPLLVYLADTSCTLARRVRSGKGWYTPHRDHVYQRLTVIGGSHTRATLLVSAVTAASAAFGLISYSAAPAVRLGSAALAILLICGYLMLPRLLTATRRARTVADRNGRLPAEHTGAAGRPDPARNTPAA